MRFNYPGYFEPNELGGYSVWFPDLPECPEAAIEKSVATEPHNTEKNVAKNVTNAGPDVCVRARRVTALRSSRQPL